jgi:hypothetical protein
MGSFYTVYLEICSQKAMFDFVSQKYRYDLCHSTISYELTNIFFSD